ncbi:hypothetical protein E3Q10_04281 [Wallemia mellicola]|uniref:Uncharacterized protein n=1 Tax=Wallemia mellicola TaxID=1708541 RepID=A0A4T0MNI3_9BASI|nr:hypothetical protein E3Q19_04292 [Wallemia mellicola]TIC23599.1 hypothetical protein E3Q10_04281 [Wallemia mellicola]TIC72308.1 hypothetical protein E3Q00_04128 [Wallemia mellicola]
MLSPEICAFKWSATTVVNKPGVDAVYTKMLSWITYQKRTAVVVQDRAFI